MAINILYRLFITSLLYAHTRKVTWHKYSKFTSHVCVDHVSHNVWICISHVKYHGTHVAHQKHGTSHVRYMESYISCVKYHETCIVWHCTRVKHEIIHMCYFSSNNWLHDSKKFSILKKGNRDRKWKSMQKSLKIKKYGNKLEFKKSTETS